MRVARAIPDSGPLAAISDTQESFVKKAEYGVFEALNPFFEVVLRGLSGLVDGEHYFDAIADGAIFESRYHFPGWPVTIRGRGNLLSASLSGLFRCSRRSGRRFLSGRSLGNSVSPKLDCTQKLRVHGNDERG